MWPMTTVANRIEFSKRWRIEKPNRFAVRRILNSRGFSRRVADRKSIDRVLKLMRSLANLRNKTDTDRQADYDSQVGKFLEEVLGRRL